MRVALQCVENRGGRCSLAVQHRARGRLEVRGDDGSFLLGAGQVAGRVDDGGQRRCRRGGDRLLAGRQRLEVGRVDDLVVVHQAALAGRVLRQAKRQRAEPARRQPHEPRAGCDAALLQNGIERGADEAPQLGSEAVDGAEPFGPALLHVLAGEIVDEIGPEPARRHVASISADQHFLQARGRQFRQVDDRDEAALGHDEQLAALAGYDGNGDRAAAGHDRMRLIHGDLRVVAGALHELQQLLARARPAEPAL